jgi:hypothetical protein
MSNPSAPTQVRPVCDYARDDLRQSSRFRKEPGTDFALFTAPGREAVWTEVYDESLTGICLVLANLRGLEVGMKTELVYRETPLSAEVRHVTPQPDGSFLVGLACERALKPEAQVRA